MELSCEELEYVFLSDKNCKFLQYVSTMHPGFSYDSDLGLFFTGSEEKGQALLDKYAEEFKNSIKEKTTADDIEVFSTENLWDLDAFELGDIIKINKSYYNFSELYRYFYTQFSTYDPFYNDDDNVEEDSVFTEKTDVILLPHSREPFTLDQIKQIIFSNDWWIPVKIDWKVNLEEPDNNYSGKDSFIKLEDLLDDDDYYDDVYEGRYFNQGRHVNRCQEALYYENEEGDYFPYVDHDENDIYAYDDEDAYSEDSESKEIDYPYSESDSYNYQQYSSDDDYDSEYSGEFHQDQGEWDD